MGKLKSKVIRGAAVRKLSVEKQVFIKSYASYIDIANAIVKAYGLPPVTQDKPSCKRFVKNFIKRSSVVARPPKIILRRHNPEPDLTFLKSKDFLYTNEWYQTRYKAIKKYGNKCQCCGAGPEDGAVIQVDHIKPRCLFPELAMDINNLQVLCRDCNMGKGFTDVTQWRGETKQF